MNFTSAGRLYGHTDSINCLAISNDGSLLASGGAYIYSFLGGEFHSSILSGSDAMRLWDLEGFREMRPPNRPDYRVQRRGQVTCAAWLPMTSEKARTLLFASALGYIQVWTAADKV